jgi:hypothetical protein
MFSVTAVFTLEASFLVYQEPLMASTRFEACGSDRISLATEVPQFLNLAVANGQATACPQVEQRVKKISREH